MVTNSSVLLQVANSLFDTNNLKTKRHLYLQVSNGRLLETHIKAEGASVARIYDFINANMTHFRSEEKRGEALFCLRKINARYIEKHSSLIARIIRFFSAFAKKSFNDTLAAFYRAEESVKNGRLEKKEEIPPSRLTTNSSEQSTNKPEEPVKRSGCAEVPLDTSLTQTSNFTSQAVEDRPPIEELPHEPPVDDRLHEDNRPDESQSAMINENTPERQALAATKEVEKLAWQEIILNHFEKAIKMRVENAQKSLSHSVWSKIPSLLQNRDLDLGVRIQKISASVFKHHTLNFQSKTFTDGTTKLIVTGKLSRPKGQEIQVTLEDVFDYSSSFFEGLPQGFCQGVTAKKERAFFPEKSTINELPFSGNYEPDDGSPLRGYRVNGDVDAIEFKGVATIRIGREGTLLNRIEIECDAALSTAEAAEKIPIILASLGLGEALFSPFQEDIERVKLMQLFRIYHPKEAYAFERKEITFQEPLDSLKERICKVVPAMKERIDKQLGEMYQQEVYPGYSIWAVKDFAKEIEKVGGTYLMAGVTDYNLTHLTSIFQKGALSTLDRFESGMIVQGASCKGDFEEGAADAVFVRLITENKLKTDDYSLSGKIQILYDLALLERGGYAYPDDRFGTKKNPYYQNRDNLLSLTEMYSTNNGYLSNEVCIRNRIPPQFIKGLVVPDDTCKNKLISEFEKTGLVTTNSEQIKCLNGIPLDHFFHISEIRSPTIKKIFKDGSLCEKNLTGEGMISYQDKTEEGVFENDLLNGKGIRIFKNSGTIEEGIFSNGLLISGKWTHGEYWKEGTFDEQTFSGKGKTADKEGDFVKNALVKGKYLKEGILYEGTFKYSRLHGQGKKTLADGTILEGVFSCDLLYGQGKMTYPNGTFVTGEFFEDRLEDK